MILPFLLRLVRACANFSSASRLGLAAIRADRVASLVTAIGALVIGCFQSQDLRARLRYCRLVRRKPHSFLPYTPGSYHSPCLYYFDCELHDQAFFIASLACCLISRGRRQKPFEKKLRRRLSRVRGNYFDENQDRKITRREAQALIRSGPMVGARNSEGRKTWRNAISEINYERE
jgi:hypothetical protein